jgi:hypothetical protein
MPQNPSNPNWNPEKALRFLQTGVLDGATIDAGIMGEPSKPPPTPPVSAIANSTPSRGKKNKYEHIADALREEWPDGRPAYSVDVLRAKLLEKRPELIPIGKRNLEKALNVLKSIW